LTRFIQQAEERIFNSVQFPSLRKNVTALTSAFPADSRAMYLNAPGDFLASYSIAVIDNSGNYEYLLNKDVNYLRAAYPNPSTTGIPKYYALFGPATTNTNPPVITNELTFFLAPTPDAAYTVEMHYFFSTLSQLQVRTIAQHWQQTPRGLGITLILPYCTGHWLRRTPT
jgi:hypothetical protein